MNTYGKVFACLGLGLGLASVAHIPRAQAQPDGHVSIRIGVVPPLPVFEPVPGVRIGFVWAPGYWRWGGHRFAWVRGHWMRHRPGHRYVRPRWVRHGHSWQLRRGYWQRAVQRRHASHRYQRYQHSQHSRHTNKHRPYRSHKRHGNRQHGRHH